MNDSTSRHGACCNVDTVRTSWAIEPSGYDEFRVRTAAYALPSLH